MPFIYKGIDSDIRNDFVEVSASRVNAANLLVRDKRGPVTTALDDMVRERRTVIFVGSPGIGKSTYLMHCVLEILEKRAKFLYANESPVPIFVPLKLVRNSGKDPIRAHVLDSEPFLGDETLFRYVFEKLGVLLCLDGYDEIAQTGTDVNPIRTELESLLRVGAQGTSTVPWTRAMGAPSRVWLTSRLQYLSHNPIGAIGDSSKLADPGVGVMQLNGLGHDRELLITRIFGKYEGMPHADRLNAELFLQLVDRSYDDEIAEAARNPLFLTVMAFNYAQAVLATGNHEAGFGSRFDEVVYECVRLLIRDLDQQKVHSQPPVVQAAIMNRRNQLPSVKLAYLDFVAATAYLQREAVLTEALLTKWMDDFARDPAHAAYAVELNDIRLRTSLPRQVIDCGVFVLVKIAHGTEYLDFPHRRFKEVLACRHFANPDNYVALLQHVVSTGVAENVELCALMQASQLIQAVDLQRQALDKILAASFATTKVKDSVGLTDVYCGLLDPRLAVGEVVKRFLDAAIRHGTVEFEVSARVLGLLQPGQLISIELMTLLDRGTRENRLDLVDLTCCVATHTEHRATMAKYLVQTLRNPFPEALRACLWGWLAGIDVEAASSLVDVFGDLDNCSDVAVSVFADVIARGDRDIASHLATRINTDFRAKLLVHEAEWVHAGLRPASDYEMLRLTLGSALPAKLVRELVGHPLNSNPVYWVGSSTHLVVRATLRALLEKRGDGPSAPNVRGSGFLVLVASERSARKGPRLGALQYAAVPEAEVKFTEQTIQARLKEVEEKVCNDLAPIRAIAAECVAQLFRTASFEHADMTSLPVAPERPWELSALTDLVLRSIESSSTFAYADCAPVARQPRCTPEAARLRPRLFVPPS